MPTNFTGLLEIGKENNKITCEAYGDSHMGNEKSFFYMYLDIDYDFNSDNVTSYNMYMAPVENDSIGSPSDISAEKYKENVLYKFRTNSTEAQAELARTINDLFFEPFKEVVKTSITIDTDFSNEYTKATNDIFGDNFF